MKTISIVLVIIGLLSLGVIWTYTIIQAPTSAFVPTSLSMIQFTGEVLEELGDGWIVDHPFPISKNAKVAIIDDFRIEIQQQTHRLEPLFENDNPLYECNPNDCSGVFLSVQEKPEHAPENLECMLWEADITETRKCYYRTVDPVDICQFKVPSEYAQFASSSCPKETFVPIDQRTGKSSGCYYGTVQVASTEICGGYNAINQVGDCCDLPMCWYKATIFKGNTQILETPWNRKSQSINIENLDIQLSQSRKKANNQCIRIKNVYQWKIPEDSFVFDIEIPTEELKQGEDIVAIVTINNNWKQVKANLVADFEVETGLETPSTETVEQIVDINLGQNTFTYTIPSQLIPSELKFTPSLSVLLEGNKFSGVNGQCFRQGNNLIADLSQCDFVEIGKLLEPTKIIKISPEIRDCRQVDCEDGFKCNQGTGNCEKTETIEKISPTIIIIIILAAASLVTLLIVIFRRKKK